MKGIVENSIKFWANPQTKIKQCEEMNDIIDCIVNSNNEHELRTKIKKEKYEHFLIGFGGSHMWVKQLIRNQANQQIIFVDFETK